MVVGIQHEHVRLMGSFFDVEASVWGACPELGIMAAEAVRPLYVAQTHALKVKGEAFQGQLEDRSFSLKRQALLPGYSFSS